MPTYNIVQPNRFILNSPVSANSVKKASKAYSADYGVDRVQQIANGEMPTLVPSTFDGQPKTYLEHADNAAAALRILGTLNKNVLRTLDKNDIVRLGSRALPLLPKVARVVAHANPYFWLIDTAQFAYDYSKHVQELNALSPEQLKSRIASGDFTDF